MFSKILLVKLTVAISFLLLSGMSFAQGEGTVRGIVSDSTSGEALAFGNAFIAELNVGSTTDSRGYFMITSVSVCDSYTLIISYVGYKRKEIKISVQPDKVTHVDVQLVPVSIELQTVEKVGEKSVGENATDVGLIRIAIRDLENLPMGVETDVFRSLQYIPGVSKVGDVSAKYFVRGGGTNQNLILLDKAPIYYPFHAFGIFSAIDPAIINSMEFYKGGFTCEYQSRLSSVLKLVTKDGNKYKYGAKASLSFLTGKLLVEGPFYSGAFMLSARASHSTEILKKFLGKSAPIKFYDFSLKTSFLSEEFMEGAKWTFSYFQSGDELASNDPTQADFNWRNQILSVDLFQITNNPLYYQIGFWWSIFDGKVYPNLSNTTRKSNRLNDLTLQVDFNYVYGSQDELVTGFKIMEVHNKLVIENTAGLPKKLGERGVNWSVYMKYKLLRFDDFKADFGTRFNLTCLAKGTSGKHYYEPRISLSYRVSEDLHLKGAWGIYHQELTTLSDENEIISLFEPWVITPSYLEPSSASHSILGLNGNLCEELSFEIEGYYKYMTDLPTLNDKKYFPDDPELIAATGEAYGCEFLSRYVLHPLSISASYALAWAFKELDGVKYRPKYDSRHTGNITIEYVFGNGWRASLAWNYSTGLPFTQIAGFYDQINHAGRNDDLVIFGGFKPYLIFANRNLGRMPDYHKLDLNVSKTFRIGRTDFKLNASLLNVYDRKNLFYFERNTGKRVNMLPFLPTLNIEVML